jgi:primosomal protein N''
MFPQDDDMQDQTDFAADMADLTRLEQQARQQRAAFMAEMLTAGWHAFTSLFAAHRTAS